MARFIMCSFVACVTMFLVLPEFALAQVGRTAAVPSVWAHNTDDQILADELTRVLRTAVSAVPDWTLSGLDVPLSELMWACQTEVAAAHDECMARMAIARDPSVADDLFIMAGLFRVEGGSAATLRLTLSIYDIASGTALGNRDFEIERIESPAVRSLHAGEWLNALAHMVAPLPETAADITAESSRVLVLGIDSSEGDDEFSHTLTNALRRAARRSTRWTHVESDTPLSQMMLAVEACEGQSLPDAACLDAIAIWGAEPVDLLVYGTLHRTGEGERLRMVLDLALYDRRVHRVTRGFSSEMTVEEVMTLSDRERLCAGFVSRLAAAVSPDEAVLLPSAPSPDAEAPVSMAPGGFFDAEYVGWPLIGLAGVSLVIEIASWVMLGNVQNDPDFMALRTAYGAGTGDVCAQAPIGTPMNARGHDLCRAAADWESVELAFGVIGGAALAGGLVALVLDATTGPSGEHAMLIRPQVGPTVAGLTLGGRF